MKSTTKNVPAETPGGAGTAIVLWLYLISFLVVCIVTIGGITRLTESGLSITKWELISGIMPPFGDAQWQVEFDRYKQTAEFKFESGPAGLTLADFKFIYFWEWFHRLLGRLIGLAYFVPLVWFWVKQLIPTGFQLRLWALFALICGQGALGWFMVASGVGTELTDVSHFRLSAHLLTALFLLAGLIWTARDLDARLRNPAASITKISLSSCVIILILFVQLLLGAWVAGLNAGHAAYDWPLMNGQIIPQINGNHSLVKMVTADPFMLNFLHRWWAWIVVAALIFLARQIRRTNRRAAVALHISYGTMALLGIATILTQVSLWVAVAHQFVGAILVASTAIAIHIKETPDEAKR